MQHWQLVAVSSPCVTLCEATPHARVLRAEDEDAGGKAPPKAAPRNKPAEHRALFDGDLDDHFRIGIKLTRGAVKLYADFYSSDVLLASPLGLITLLEETGGPGAADFLSSIEILVIERADVLLMQNWAHVVTGGGSVPGGGWDGFVTASGQMGVCWHPATFFTCTLCDGMCVL
jgi:hypothetical protein